MKVVLTTPPIMDYSSGHAWGRIVPIAQDKVRECPAYGIYMLANILQQAGHHVVVADLIALGTHNIALYADDIKDCSLVGIGTTSRMYQYSTLLVQAG